MSEEGTDGGRIPRDPDDDYAPAAAAKRRDFLRERTGTELADVGSFSFDPGVLPGNVENFIGVAQVPWGRRLPVPRQPGREVRLQACKAGRSAMIRPRRGFDGTGRFQKGKLTGDLTVDLPGAPATPLTPGEGVLRSTGIGLLPCDPFGG